MHTIVQQQARPFLKWAGGKGQLLTQIEQYLPKELTLTSKIKKYFEPFLGGGALFFWLSNRFDFEKSYLYEINPEIVMCYKTIQSDVPKLIKKLKELETQYLSFSETKREAFFYDLRDEYNAYLNRKIKNHFVPRSALLIFLNKTCFNGLYRVNSKGEFNVPFGRYKNPTICDEDNLWAVHEALQRAEIIEDDFAQCLKHIDDESFVYFDPPYRPISSTASFNSYSKNIFDDAEQLRLKETFNEINNKEGLAMLSNSDPKNIDPEDHFFDNLYHDYRIERLNATRMINCNADKRGDIKEILVMNY